MLLSDGPLTPRDRSHALRTGPGEFVSYVNGNRRRNGIKIGHINLGSGYLVNKMNSIETIIGGYKPHILGISESCFKKSHDKNDIQIDDYNVFFSKTLENQSLNASRVSVFTHKDLTVKERPDLMNDSFSSVWPRWGYPKARKSLFVTFTVTGSI